MGAKIKPKKQELDSFFFLKEWCTKEQAYQKKAAKWMSAFTQDCRLSGLRSNLHHVKKTKVCPCVPGTVPQWTVCSSVYLSHFCHRVNLLSADNPLMLLWMGKWQMCSLKRPNKTAVCQVYIRMFFIGLFISVIVSITRTLILKKLYL